MPQYLLYIAVWGANTSPTAGTRTQIVPTQQNILLSKARSHIGMGSTLLHGSVSSPMQEAAASHCRSGSLARPGVIVLTLA